MDNQNLIHSITHYFDGYNSKEDLFQVGAIGLINAYKKYNPELGVKFTTYAYPYILGEMRKYVREDKGIKISRDITKLNLRIEKATILLSQKLMREPTINELSHYLEIPESYLVESLKAINVLQSIDEPINSNDGKQMSLHDTVCNINEMDLNSLIQLKEELNTLTPFEKSIINTRYMRDMTQSEAAKALGMSQVQISRKEQKVLTKLRSKLLN
jgi:RNA polymerase sporulation-specific sigma factor